MFSNKKRLLAAGLFIFAAGAMLLQASSLFTAKGETPSEIKAGNIQIALSSIEMEDSDNISPGDGDPYNARNISTADHKISFKITNEGSKSVKTKQTLLLFANNGVLDPRHLMILDEDKRELSNKTYILENGEFTDYISGNEKKIIAIKYEVEGDSFEGAGDEGEKEDISKIVKSERGKDPQKEYEYYLALSHLAPNSYQNADIQMYFVAHAIQFRHTETKDFENAFTAKKSFSTSGKEFTLDFIPSNDEDADGNRF